MNGKLKKVKNIKKNVKYENWFEPTTV